MKIFNSKRNIILASIGILFASLILISCEKREDLDFVTNTKYSKFIAFSQVVNTTRSMIADYEESLPNATFVLRNIEENQDSLFLMTYVTDIKEDLLTRADTYDDEKVFGTDGFSIFAIANGSELNNLTGTVVKNGDAWHYSPDDKNWSELGSNSVQFYAYDNFFETSNVNNNIYGITRSATSLNVVMPTNSGNQTDVVVAKSNSEYNSSSNSVVPLIFNHIFAGVKFEIGDLNAEVGGYVSAITIEGMYGSATYNMATNSWTGLDASNTKTFTVGGIITNNQTKGKPVGSTLMVIPGQLSGDAKINITFITGNGTPRTLSASLAGGNFEAGKLYTCKINVNRVDLLAIQQHPNSYADAHYVIDSITVFLDSKLKNATLNVTSSDGATIELCDELNSFERDGYCIDNSTLGVTINDIQYKKHSESSITWTSINSNTSKKVYLFYPENITSSPRTITVKLTGTGDDNQAATSESIIVKQFCPTKTGCERIEEHPYQPWGPYWQFTNPDAEPVIKYDFNLGNALGNVLEGNWSGLWLAIRGYAISSGWIEPQVGVTYEMTGSFVKRLKSITIDFNEYLSFDQAPDATGLINTQHIFNGEDGNADLVELTATVESILAAGDAVSLQSGSNSLETLEMQNFDNSAIIASVKKNKFSLVRVDGGSTGEDAKVSIESTNIKWYLPSLNEIKGNSIETSDLQYKGELGETPLDGVYWSSTTSTAVPISNSMAYTWYSDPEIDMIRSHAEYKVRAVRAVTDGCTFQNATN